MTNQESWKSAPGSSPTTRRTPRSTLRRRSALAVGLVAGSLLVFSLVWNLSRGDEDPEASVEDRPSLAVPEAPPEPRAPPSAATPLPAISTSAFPRESTTDGVVVVCHARVAEGPAAGAEISVEIGLPGGKRVAQTAFSGTTGSARFVFPRVTVQGSAEFLVTGALEGYAPALRTAPVPEAGAVADVTLDFVSGGGIEGIVVDETAHGVEGVAVMLERGFNSTVSEIAGTSLAAQWLRRRTTGTDANGTFAFSMLPAGEYTLRFHKTDLRIGRGLVRLSIAPRSTEGLYVLAQPTYACRLRVLVEGKPVDDPFSLAVAPKSEGGASFITVPRPELEGPESAERGSMSTGGVREFFLVRNLPQSTGPLESLSSASAAWAGEGSLQNPILQVRVNRLGSPTLCTEVPLLPFEHGREIPVTSLALGGAAATCAVTFVAEWADPEAAGALLSVMLVPNRPNTSEAFATGVRTLPLSGGRGTLSLPPGRYTLSPGLPSPRGVSVPFVPTGFDATVDRTVMLLPVPGYRRAELRPGCAGGIAVDSFGVSYAPGPSNPARQVGVGTGGVAHVWLPEGKGRLVIQADGYRLFETPVSIAPGVTALVFEPKLLLDA